MHFVLLQPVLPGLLCLGEISQHMLLSITNMHLLLPWWHAHQVRLRLMAAFPAHHEVVLNPNICSAMAVMRCCPEREVQAVALSLGCRKGSSSKLHTLILPTFPAVLGPGPDAGRAPRVAPSPVKPPDEHDGDNRGGEGGGEEPADEREGDEARAALITRPSPAPECCCM